MLSARFQVQHKSSRDRISGPTGECIAGRKKRLQRKSNDSAIETQNDSEVPPIVHEVLRSPGQPLDAQTRAFMEPRFGHDFSNVRLHTDAKSVESTHAVQADAYTVGDNVVFGANRWAPTTRPGRELFAHELAHTIQQRDAGGPPRSADFSGIFEASANAAGRKVANGEVVSPNLPACGRRIQRAPGNDLRWKNDVKTARFRGQLMANRVRKHGELSSEARAKINQELGYFEGEAKETYLQEVRPILKATVEIEMPAVEARPEPAKPEVSKPTEQGVAHYEPGEYEAMAAFYGSERQSQLAAMRTQLRKDVYHMSPKQIYERWQQGGPTWVALASSPGHALGHEQFFHIWLENWRHKYNEARTRIDEIQKREAAIDEHEFAKKMIRFWDTGHNEHDVFGPEYRQAVELSEVATVMFRSSNDALIMAEAAENGGKDVTIDQFDRMVLNHAAWSDAFTNIAEAFAAAYGGYEPGKATSKVPDAPKGPPRSPAVTPTSTGGGEPAGANAVPEPIEAETTGRVPAGEPPGEVVGNYRLLGETTPGKTFVRRILGISRVRSMTRPAATGENFKPLFESFIREASASGSDRLRVTIEVIRNPKVFERVFEIKDWIQSLGGHVNIPDPGTVEVTIPLSPR